MKNYRCATCGKLFDPEKSEICPSCGAAVAPSVLTRIERKQTAVRLRAEGKLNYDDHCHEDDAWVGSAAAQNHRAAVRSHEATLRAGYAAHTPADNPTRLSNANTYAQSRPVVRRQPKKLSKVLQDKPFLFFVLFFMILVGVIVFFSVVSAIMSCVDSFSSPGFYFN